MRRPTELRSKRRKHYRNHAPSQARPGKALKDTGVARGRIAADVRELRATSFAAARGHRDRAAHGPQRRLPHGGPSPPDRST